MATTYTVKKGDTLSEIARDNNTTVDALLKLNPSITNRDLIYIGQVIKLSGTADTVQTNTTSAPKITNFGLQSNSDNLLFATWTWDKSNVDYYEVRWWYAAKGQPLLLGRDGHVTQKHDTYTIPSNAAKVQFAVRPIAKKRKVNGTETPHWYANWSEWKYFNVAEDTPPSTPPVPTVEIKDYTLTASVDNLDVNADKIQFQIVKNDSTVYKTGTATIKTNSASYSCTIDVGNEYKVRCRSVRDGVYSEWSDYSGNGTTKPSASSGITVCRASSATSVYLEWAKVNSATSYDLEYTTKKEYFEGSDKTTTVSGITTTQYEKTGLTSGEEYFFRVRAVNDQGESAWSAVKSVIIGKAPAAPTTWSSTTTAKVGESLNLYWVHNSEDESKQTYAELELTIDGKKTTHTIKNTAVEDEDENKTSSYSIDTSDYIEGSKILWRVRTAGVTKVYGEWSIQRTVDIYAPPTLELSVTKNDGSLIETLNSFPFYIKGTAAPNTQKPIGYHVLIISNDTYDTMDALGNNLTVGRGTEVYSKYFDTSYPLTLIISASDVDLANGVAYTVKCTVAMDSGLTAESSCEFDVVWTDEMYEPNAEIVLNSDDLTVSIAPHCKDENGEFIEGVLLSVYRREYDGGFVELAKDIANGNDTFVTDPHPALDYARYRIIARTESTGAVSYCDIPGYPVGEKAVIVQWDEEWSNFEATSEDPLVEPSWTGSMLKLPYNIDVSDSNRPDVALIEYIGRKYPVSYYGTQVGATATWNVEIDAADKETLYALRRLSIWMGDVYVREPSGSGYWANIAVSFNQKHRSLTIPVTLNITRVAGGA